MINIINNFLNIFGYREFATSSQKLAKMELTIKRLEETIQNQNTLLNNVSHEIRTPMHSIYNISEFLNDYWYTLDEDQRKMQVQSITDISSWLKNFTNSMLDISKFHAGKMIFDFTKFDLLSLIKETIEHSKKALLFNKPDLEIVFHNIDLDQAMVFADPFRIRQLLQNLIDNAVKYTVYGTIVIKITAVTYNSHVAWQLDFIDQGVGVPPAELEVIFNSFIRSSNKYGIGTGLGLSICREIAEAHRGHLWAENNNNKSNESSVAKGTTFSFILPIDNY